MTKKQTNTQQSKTTKHRKLTEAVRPLCGPSRRLNEALRLAVASSNVRRQPLDILALEGFADRLRRTRAAEHTANAFAAYSVTDTGKSMFRQTAYESAVAMTLARMVDQGKSPVEAQELITAAIIRRKKNVSDQLRLQNKIEAYKIRLDAKHNPSQAMLDAANSVSAQNCADVLLHEPLLGAIRERKTDGLGSRTNG